MLKSINILGTKITSESENKVLEYILQRLKKGGKKFFITTPNPEILTYAYLHSDYRNKLNEAEVALPDGVGVLLAAKIVRKPIRERITGTDFIEKLCLASKDQPISMGFLGGKRGVAEKTAERLKSRYPWLNITFVGEEWSEAGFINAQVFSMKYLVSGMRKKIPNTKYQIPNTIDLVFVAYGFPKQEEWIYENLDKLPVKAAMGVGGAFDYISGEVMRAPVFMRKIGLEWLFRLFRQPWRWRRQLALIKFVWLLFKKA